MQTVKFSLPQIKAVLNTLSIPTNDEIKNNWLGILCPLPQHSGRDKHFGNCSINIETGIISCFACGYASHIIGIYKDRMNVSYKEAYKCVMGSEFSSSQKVTIKREQKEIEPTFKSIAERNFTEIDLIPENFYYTRKRGFTKEFCNQFGLKHCISGNYNDYFIIPIIDKNKNIFEYEARKLLEYEYLSKLFDSNRSSLKQLKIRFQEYVRENKIQYKNFKVYSDSKEIYNPLIQYLFESKVKYVANSKVKHTLWNIDNLNYNDDLYVVEGIGSIPKIYCNISKNCTTFFGSKISEWQVEYLKKFKKIIHIPDFDEAGYNSVKFLNMRLNNYYVSDVKREDTDTNFVDLIKNLPLLNASQYLSIYFFSFSK